MNSNYYIDVYVIIIRLQVKMLRVLGEITWPVPSPDGTAQRNEENHDKLLNAHDSVAETDAKLRAVFHRF